MLIIHDKRLPEAYKKKIKEKIPSAELYAFGSSDDPYFNDVYESIAYHPDIYFFQLDRERVIHAPSIPEEELEVLRKKGIKLVKGDKDPWSTYPASARFNAARVGKYIFHNLDLTDPVIIEYADKNHLKLVNIAQGYARCNIVPVSENAIITADQGIIEAAFNEGLDVGELWREPVLLPGEEYGFIGGSCGVFPDGTLLFLGDINTHRGAEIIKDFLKKHDIMYFSLEGLPLYDAGSLLIF